VDLVLVLSEQHLSTRAVGMGDSGSDQSPDESYLTSGSVDLAVTIHFAYEIGTCQNISQIRDHGIGSWSKVLRKSVNSVTLRSSTSS